MIKGDKQQGEEERCVCAFAHATCGHLHNQAEGMGVREAQGNGEILPPYYCGYRVDLATGPRGCSTWPALLEPH